MKTDNNMFAQKDSLSKSYNKLSILELALLVINEADREAQNVLLSRAVYSDNTVSYNVPDYLNLLKNQYSRTGYDSLMVAEKAYDLALAKFYNFPQDHNKGVDCRFYYRAFVEHLTFAADGMDMIAQEMVAVKKLRNYICRIFKWSCLDAKRQEKGFSKIFLWELDDKSYKLRMPSVMTSKQCSQWLECNIDGPDLESSYEKERIQQIIDDTLFTPSNISLCSSCFKDFKAPLSTPLSQIIEDEMAARPLPECIANEKSDNLDMLRASIARIGKKKVKKLVIAIFDAINTDSYKPSLLGAEFGISPAAMTRFASLKWSDNGGEKQLPDLWKNVARYTVNHSDYAKLLYETGLYGKLSSLVQEN